jgi:uncharacterized protein (UPF0335 family)
MVKSRVTVGGSDKEEKAHKLREAGFTEVAPFTFEAPDEPAEPTISINGGEQFPMSDVRKALDMVNSRHGDEGHNSGVVAADQLRLFIERVERLKEEQKGLADDVKDVFSEAKSNGYDTKTMRKIISLRAQEKHVRQEEEALLETYKIALEMA